MDLEKLLQEGDTLRLQIEELEEKALAAGPEEKAAVDAALAAKQAEWETFTGKVAAVKAAQARQAVLDGLKASKVAVPGGSLTPAQPRDGEAEEAAKVDAFTRYALGEPVSNREMHLLAPAGKSWKDAVGGVVMPASLRAKVFSNIYGPVRGKQLTSTSTAGAALIPEDYRPQLLALTAEPAFLLARCTVVPAPTGTIRWPRLVQTDDNEYGAVHFEWTQEGGEKPETTPDFDDVTITCSECAGYTEIPLTMLSRSAIDLETLLTRLYRDAAGDVMERVIIGGSGTGQPLGALNTVGIRSVTRAAAGEVGWRDLANLKHAVRPYHRGRAVFVLGDDVERGLELAVDSVNRPLFNASAANGPYDRLVGYPYFTTTRTPALGTSGDIIFGDWAEYIVALESEVVIKRSDHYRFRHNKAAFTLFFSMGGQLVQPRAMAILGEES
jgi:HK97 family phage major capsid protein